MQRSVGKDHPHTLYSTITFYSQPYALVDLLKHGQLNVRFWRKAKSHGAEYGFCTQRGHQGTILGTMNDDLNLRRVGGRNSW